MKLNRRFIIPSSSYKGIEMPSKEFVYGFKINKEGQKEFCVIGEHDIATERNSYLDVCDFKMLYNSVCPPFSAFEDMSDYMEQFQELDLSDPIIFANYAEHLRDDFFSLPEKIRNKYGNNIEQFTSAVYRGDFDLFIDSEFEKEELKQQESDKLIEQNRPLNSDELNRIRAILDGGDSINNESTTKNKGE